MFQSIPHPHYFSYKSSKDIKEIYWLTVINGVALAMALIFEPIFLYGLGFDLISIMWYYAQVYFWYITLVFLGASFAHKFGLKKSILISNFIYPLYWFVLFSIPKHMEFFALAPFLFALQKSFFWPAYNTLSALASAKTQRGRQLGLINSISNVAFIVGPVLGGWISQSFGFSTLFITTSVLMVSSSAPLFFTPDIKFEGWFSLTKFFEFLAANKRNFFAYWGYAEDLMLMSLWPILMFIIVKQFLGVGIISTFASLVAAVLMLYIGKLSDKKDKHKLVAETSYFYSVTWFFRFVAVDMISVIIFDSLTKIGKALVNVPLVALTLETAREANSGFPLRYATFYEFSLSIGKIFTAISAIIILTYTSNIYIVFILVGFLTLFYSLLSNKIIRPK